MSNIDKEQQPEQQNNQQNELNLDFDEFEPITPKRAAKAPETAPSFFDKIKGLLAKKSAKQEAPTFAPAEENNQYAEFDTEPVTTNKTSAIKNLPTRYRRLAISLAVLLIIICLFIWLKPNSQPVDNLQSQENNLPIEFQPIDPNAAAEANTPPQPNATDGNAVPATNETATANDAATTANTLTQDAAANPAAQQPAVDNTPITTDAPAANAAPTVDNSSTAAPAPAEKPAQPAQPALTQEQIKQIEKKAYEEEQARLVAQAKARAEQRAREEFRAKQQQQKEKESRKAQALLNGKEVPVVEAKPTPRTTNKTTSTAATGGATKVLTVPAGTSLMQVFRDNKLNIADVNAMTKANGAGNALSSFKPGDKVSVNVNSEGRVSELRLPNGDKFIRQSNGSYIYQK
ncbi:LysM-like peptidoglycan-binding domain-containing protein [Gallibacterium salpingitidis]|uniref:Opacity-associated protein A LysM-like domain-containing protein n=1 Tax=Gallibacterium salpingitidis TaxID=505341 RepID=A0A1A7P277_9PAST|nr:LysM-like peptidoglycan-binding domain-containing protein [Gallibacterium salpingitidis]OBW96108.1 Opacity-associated protein A LysM-like domain-containing protein [Gallibacterium salpingitidis]